jgi:hypothetical protein
MCERSENQRRKKVSYRKIYPRVEKQYKKSKMDDVKSGI